MKSSGSPDDRNRPSGQCADSVIRVVLSMPKGAAGSFLQDVSFINTGSSPCVLRGAPGLSVVGEGNGTQLGAPATRDQADAATVRLAAHGGSAYAPFTGPELEPGAAGAKACTGSVRHGDGYRVYSPHSRRAFFLADTDALACASGDAFLRIGVVRPTGTP